MTHYERLGVKQNASADEIKSAFRAVVKKYHPDIYSGDKDYAEKLMRKINDAYEILSNPQKRAAYDLQLKLKAEKDQNAKQKESPKQPSKNSSPKETVNEQHYTQSAPQQAYQQQAYQQQAYQQQTYQQQAYQQQAYQQQAYQQQTYQQQAYQQQNQYSYTKPEPVKKKKRNLIAALILFFVVGAGLVLGLLLNTGSPEVINYSLIYRAAQGGIISGSENQMVGKGESGDEVKAVANPGYAFSAWSDGLKTPERKDSNVKGEIDVTANFTALNIETVTLKYEAGIGGKIIGDTEQIVKKGEPGSEVRAEPEAGYEFAGWSDGKNTAGRIDFYLVNLTVTAYFEKQLYPVTYSAGAGGYIIGEANQNILFGGDASAVTAVPLTGYKFVMWSDYKTELTRQDKNITGSTVCTAYFEKLTYSVTYSAGIGGSISGNTNQVVAYGNNSSTVTATASNGYEFTGWNDGKTEASRYEINVTSARTFAAQFRKRFYSVAYSSTSGGTVNFTGPQNLEYGSSVTVMATADAANGYDFIGWSDGKKDNPRTDTVSGSINVSAQFGYFAGGSGSAQSPFLITSERQLKNIERYPAAGYYFELTADFALSSGFNSLMASDLDGFKGVLDGKNHKITYKAIKNLGVSEDFYFSLFDSVTKTGVIKNLKSDIEYKTQSGDYVTAGAITGYNYGKIQNCTMTGSINISGAKLVYIGGIAAFNEGEISGCSINVSISAKNILSNVYAGGIAGESFQSKYATETSTRTLNNTVNVVMDITSQGYICAGGAIGLSYGGVVSGGGVTSEIKAVSYDSDYISFPSSAVDAGGFAGVISNNDIITNCAVVSSKLDITAIYQFTAGGFAGSIINGATVGNSFVNKCDIAAKTEGSADSECYAGGFIGYTAYPSDTEITGSTANNIKITLSNEFRFSAGGFIGKATGNKFDSCAVNNFILNYEGGSYNINGSYFYAGGFVGDAIDIELEDCETENVTINAGTFTTINAGGFAGRAADTIFKECSADIFELEFFDGGEYHAGGFSGYLDAVSIDSCHVTNTSLKGAGRNFTTLGGFSGIAFDSSFENSSSTAQIEKVCIDEDSFNDCQYVAGFLAFYYGGTSLKNNSAKGNISVISTSPELDIFAGGLVGDLYNYINSAVGIVNCAADVDIYIEGYADIWAGGFIGSAWSQVGMTVSNSYSEGNITAWGKNDGLIDCGGFNGDSRNINYTNCRAFGDILVTSDFGEVNAGGFIGHFNYGGYYTGSSDFIITRCYAAGDVNITAYTYTQSGGFIGLLENDYNFSGTVTIAACYALGNINSVSLNINALAGGFISAIYSNNSITVESCFSKGRLTVSALNGTAVAGGLIGDYLSEYSAVKNCYTTSVIISAQGITRYLGGLIGYSYLLPENCYFIDNSGIRAVGYCTETSIPNDGISCAYYVDEAAMKAGITANKLDGGKYFKDVAGALPSV